MGYHEKLIEIAAKLGERQDLPGVRFITVKHDAWCPALRGGPCTCCPDFVIAEEASTETRKARRKKAAKRTKGK